MKSGKSGAEVSEAIRQAIRAGELLPGMQIKQADWASRLGVSRVPVREALGMLESEGLLAHEPHQGYSVAILTQDEVKQLYLLRRLLDREIALSLVWPDAEALDALRAIYHEANAALEAGEIADWLACNDRFILAVYDLCPMEIVAGEAAKFWRRTETIRSGRIRYEWQHLKRETIQLTIARILTQLEERNRAGLKSALARLTKVRKVPAGSVAPKS